MKTLLCLTLGLSLSVASHAQYETIADGNWNDASTWLNGSVPTANTPSTAYSSIQIDHHVLFENGGVPAMIFVNNDTEISAGGSLTIDENDTLMTGEGLSGAPSFLADGNIYIEKGGSFSTMVGSPVYDQITINGTLELADSSSCMLLAYGTIENGGTIEVGVKGECILESIFGIIENGGYMNVNGDDAVLLLSAEGAIHNNGEINIEGNEAGLSVVTLTDTIFNSGNIYAVGADSVAMIFEGGTVGGIQNNGEINGNQYSVVTFSVSEDASIMNHGEIINHASATFNVSSSTATNAFENHGPIEGANCVFVGESASTWINDGPVISIASMLITDINFTGTGNFCSQMAFVTNFCDFSGTLDLCAQGFMGIIHTMSTVGPNVTNCQGICDLQSLSTPEEKVYEMNMYPNPAMDQLTIELNASGQAYSVQIISLNGSVLIDQAQESGEISYLDISNLPAGSYICRVVGFDNLLQEKLIKL